jgi:hypothetical protein
MADGALQLQNIDCGLCARRIGLRARRHSRKDRNERQQE